MSCLISGSIAFDTITTFEGRFSDHLLPDQLHILNVSFFVPTMRREFGGCAGNIAYTLAQLGTTPVVVGAVGADGTDYLARLQAMGVDTQGVRVVAGAYTAQATIITDQDNNQITAFHPGAMMHAHEVGLPPRGDVQVALVGPDGREAMLRRAADLHAAGVPFIFDPGQAMPLFDGAALHGFVQQASWVALNDYEARLLTERLGLSLAQLSSLPHLRGVVVTLGADGCELWQGGERTPVAPVAATAVLDPTGCGDAFRAALLHGLAQGWTLARCAELGSRLGALKVAQRGGQNHRVPAGWGQ